MRYAHRRGLALVEVVIALAILAIALTGIIGAIVTSMTASSLNRQTNLARDAAMMKLDEVRSHDYADALTTYAVPVVQPAFPSYSGADIFPVSGLTAGTGYVWLDPAGANNAILTIHVVVAWQSERGVRIFETSMVVTQ